MSTERETLQRALHELIPLSRAMQLSVVELGPDALTLTAPLAANHNHAGTGFAGSVYSLASLAGWALLRVVVEREHMQARLVLGEGRIRYHRPAGEELRARVELSQSEQARVIEQLRQGKTARLRLRIDIPGADDPAATFEGTYFARPA